MYRQKPNSKKRMHIQFAFEDWKNPKKELGAKEKYLRMKQVLYQRRLDVMAVDNFLIIDPRADEYQMPIPEAQAIAEAPEWKSPVLSRQRLGIVPAPYNFLDMYLRQAPGPPRPISIAGANPPPQIVRPWLQQDVKEGVDAEQEELRDKFVGRKKKLIEKRKAEAAGSASFADVTEEYRQTKGLVKPKKRRRVGKWGKR